MRILLGILDNAKIFSHINKLFFSKAFSTVAAFEAAFYRVRGYRAYMSEQMLIDCDYGQEGCDGGWPADAMWFVQQSGMTSSSYGYKNMQLSCSANRYPNKVLNRQSFNNVIEEPINLDEERLKRIVNARGPVVVAISVSTELINYGSGVFSCDYCSKDVNHAVVRFEILNFPIRLNFSLKRSYAVMELITKLAFLFGP